MEKLVIDQRTYNGYIHNILRQIAYDKWKPDYIVGITRGGLVPAVMISHYLEVPMHTLNVSLRDSTIGPESNLWMAEDAFGYEEGSTKKNILIVDDINDSGATINWIKDDWRSGCLPNDERWDQVWGHNVRFAFVVNNEASEFKQPDYVGLYINKDENNAWIDFPYEDWWLK